MEVALRTIYNPGAGPSLTYTTIERERAMDKGTIKIVIAMISTTFILLGTFVTYKVIKNNHRRELQSRVYRVDELIETGQIKMATLSLIALQRENLTSEIREQLPERFSDLLAGVDLVIASGRVQDAGFVLDKLNEITMEAPVKQRLEVLQRELDGPLKEFARNQEKAAEAKRAREQQNQKLARQRQREVEAARQHAREERLNSVGGAFLGLLFAFAFFLVASILTGFGQIIVAFRDVAINSYLIANTSTDATSRTPVAPGHIAPRYWFIPFVALVFYIVAAIGFITSACLAIYVVDALIG